MARDIEEFLRRAAERRQQQKAGGAGAPKKQPPRKQPPKRQPPQQRRSEPEPIEIIEPEVVRKPMRSSIKTERMPENKVTDLRNEAVDEHVERHINTKDIAQHAENLGKRIVSVHDQVEKQIHKHLDHDLTEIDDRPTITDDPRQGVTKSVSPIAAELLGMLSSPKSIRQAILISEILNRPSFDDD